MACPIRPITASNRPTTRRMTPRTKTTWAKAKVGTRLGRRSPRTIRMIPRTIMTSPSFCVDVWRGGLSGSVFEGVFDLGLCLFGVALELIGESLGAQAGVAGGATVELLGGALGPFALVGDLLTYAHCFLPSGRCGFFVSVITARDLELPLSTEFGAYRRPLPARGAVVCRPYDQRPRKEPLFPLGRVVTPSEFTVEPVAAPTGWCSNPGSRSRFTNSASRRDL